MSKKAIVFDLDGTLLDTLADLADAVNYALESVGEPKRTYDEVRRFVGNGVRLLMIRSIPGGEANPRFEEALEIFKKYYGEHSQDKTKAYNGIMELLSELKGRGIRMAIVSNKFDLAVKELNRIYFGEYITTAIGENEAAGIRKKPAKDTAILALEELGVSAEEALYVGDSDVDIETALNSGMECVSVTWGFRDVEFLRNHGAKRIIDVPADLLQYI